MKTYLHLPKNYIVYLIIFILIPLSSYSSDKKQEKEDVNLEDAIIIRGIKLNSLDYHHEDDGGEIIYDNDFDDSIIDYKKVKKKVKKGNRRSSQWGQLKQNDRRWHLTRYKIKRKDNLWKIARKFEIDHKLIISVNKIKNPEMLRPGKYLEIPNRNGIYYKIKKGDTISKIARKYKISSKRIFAFNRVSPRHLKIGENLFLPDVKEYIINKKKNRKNKSYYAKKSRARKIRKSMNFRWPVKGRVTSAFGRRKDPFSGRRKFHCGVDISAPVGTPIRAAADGRVIYSGWKSGYGKVVIVRHKKGYITVYAHNSKNKVKANKRVRKGNIIAYAGKTGAATGAHLHFEIRKYVNPLNPLRFIR